MPPLTWRNVDDPDLTKAARIMEGAVGNWSAGMSGASGTLTGIANRQRRDASAALVPMLAGIQNSGQVDGVLNQINSQIDPRMLTPEMQAQLLAQRGQTADVDRVLAMGASVRGGENREQTDFGRRIGREDQLATMTPDILRMQQEAYGPSVGVNNPNLSEEFRAEIPRIQPGESGGDYNKLFGNAEAEGGAFAGVRVTDMSVDEALAFQDPSGPYGQYVATNNGGTVSTPVGGYQVIGDTLGDAKAGLGLTGSEVMTPELQDRIGQWIYEQQGTGAWEGYNPDGNSHNYVADVAGLLPATGNLLLPGDVQGIVDDLYTDRRTAIGDNRTDQQDARADRLQAEQDILDAQGRTDTADGLARDTAAQDWAFEMRQQFGMGAEGQEQALEAIQLDDTLSRQEAAARTAAVNQIYTDSAEFFDADGVALNPAVDWSFNLATMEAEADLKQGELLMSDNTQAALRAGSGETPVTAENVYENIVAALGAEGAANFSSPEQLEYTVQSTFDHFDGAIPKSLIYAGLQDAVTGYGDWNPFIEEGFFLDEDKLIESLAPLAEEGALAKAQLEVFQNDQSRQAIVALQDEYRTAGEQIAFQRERTTPEAAAEVDRLLGRQSELLKAARELAGSSEVTPAKAGDESGDPRLNAPSIEQRDATAAAREAVVTENSGIAEIGEIVDQWGLGDTPVEQEAEAWFKSPEVATFLVENPTALRAANEDPLGFFQNAKSERESRAQDQRVPEPVTANQASRADWEKMSRSERQRAGLPVSLIGANWHFAFGAGATEPQG